MALHNYIYSKSKEIGPTSGQSRKTNFLLLLLAQFSRRHRKMSLVHVCWPIVCIYSQCCLSKEQLSLSSYSIANTIYLREVRVVTCASWFIPCACVTLKNAGHKTSRGRRQEEATRSLRGIGRQLDGSIRPDRTCCSFTLVERLIKKKSRILLLDILVD